ncbi:MAG: tetratricopeptide repeat protein [Planctomycetota bacterium]
MGLVGAVALCYWNSWNVPFLFDDHAAIVENPFVRRIWPIWEAMQAPRETTVAGRPTVSLSLALSYALSGERVWGFHLLNILIHAAAACLLFGILRRTFESSILGVRFGGNANGLAATIALIWAVHPLHTMCVTYIVQRAESLMGLCYLLTLYSVIRGHDSQRPRRWWCVAALACLAGMGSKEVMVTAPVVVLVYDALFLSGSFRVAFQRRAALYMGLATCWIPLGLLVASSPRPESAGMSLESITPWEYLRTQPEVILHYVRLVIWPRPLVLDYEWTIAREWRAIALPGMVVVGLLVLTVGGVIRRRPWAMAGVWFFGVLAASSSLVPIVIVASEHRMYLPSAAVISVVVLLGHLSIRRFGSGLVRIPMVITVVASLCVTTMARNLDYQSGINMWKDVIAKRPDNARAHNNLGAALEVVGDLSGALPHVEKAVQLNPTFSDARYNLGSVLGKLGRVDEAMDQLRECLRFRPQEVRAEYNLGYAYQVKGRLEDAIVHYRRAVTIKPSYELARSGLGIALALVGQFNEAVGELRTVLELEPDRVAAVNTLAWILATNPKDSIRNGTEAVQLAERANRLTGGANSGALDTLAAAYAEAGRFAEAVEAGERAAKIAEAEKQDAMANAIRGRVELYRQSKPFRDAPVPGK